MTRRLVDRRDEESGAIAVMAAVVILATLVATSLAVDVGRAAFASRDQQGVTDRAALDSVQVVKATTYGSLGQVHTAVEQGVVDSLGRNPGTSTGIERDREIGLVEIGLIEADNTFRSICSADYDPASEPACTDGANAGFTPDEVTAVRVETLAFVPFTFAIGDADGGRQVIKQSVAETLEIGSVRVGSELAALDAGLLNDMLEQILCTDYQATTAADVDADGITISGSSGTRVDAPVSSCDLAVSAVGYQGLADAQVTLGDIIDGFGLTAGSPEEALDTEVTVADLFTVLAQALDDQGGGAVVALDELRTEINQSLVVNLLGLVHVETGTVGQAAEAGINVFDLVRSSAQLVNGTNLLDAPDTGVTLPGLVDVDTDIAVVEAPQTSAIGPPGVSATTAQVDVDLDTELATDLETIVTDLLTTLGVTGTLDVTAQPVVVPVTVDVAAAEATLQSIACGDLADPTQASTSADVSTTTDVVRLGIGDGTDWVDVSRVRVVVRDPVLNTELANLLFEVRARASVPLGGATNDLNTFFGPFRSGPEHTSGSPIDFTGLTATDVQYDVQTSGSVGVLSGLVASLSSGITGAITADALPVVGELDSEVVQPLLDSLGVGVGNADTWVESIECVGRELLPLGS